MTTRLIYLSIAMVTLLATACGSANAMVSRPETAKSFSETVTKEEVPPACPVTEPPDPVFVPPAPWPAQPPGGDRFWFGQAGLWTALPINGSWAQLARGEKFWWWSEEFDVTEDETPDLKLTARRLDDRAPNFQVTEATNGYHPSFEWAMLAGVELPEPGCWEFTGQFQGHQLSLTIWVPPE